MIFFDLETTGIDVLKDHIIEIYALKISGDDKSDLHYILNPGIPIPKEASDIHGYTDEDVKDKPLFKDVAEEIYNFFQSEDLIGYNNRKFDNLLLNVELARSEFDFKLDERKTLDVYEMWTNLEPRTLAGALKRFRNESSENLHGAKEDVLVLNKIFSSMLEFFSLKEKTFEHVCKLACPDEKSLCFGKLLINDDSELVLNFGKYCGRTVHDIMDFDYDYLKWIANESKMDSAVKYYLIVEVRRIKKLISENK